MGDVILAARASLQYAIYVYVRTLRSYIVRQSVASLTRTYEVGTGTSAPVPYTYGTGTVSAWYTASHCSGALGILYCTVPYSKVQYSTWRAGHSRVGPL